MRNQEQLTRGEQCEQNVMLLTIKDENTKK